MSDAPQVNPPGTFDSWAGLTVEFWCHHCQHPRALVAEPPTKTNDNGSLTGVLRCGACHTAVTMLKVAP